MNNRPIKILLIEDNPGDVRLIKEMLSGVQGCALEYQIEHTDKLNTGLECLAKGGIDIVLLDLLLPDCQGIDTFTRTNAQAPLVPIVVFSCQDDEMLAIETVKRGAQDYLVKGQVNNNLLVRSINYAIERKKIEEQLAQKSEEIEKMNKEMNDFIYTVSHDMKEPLFSMEGYTSRLSRAYGNTLDEKGKRYIERLKANIEKMSKRINDIMEVIKVGKVEYNFTNNNGRDIVRDVVNELESKIKNNKINVTIRDDLPTLICDRKNLRNVFLNLISNAIKFMGNDEQRQVKIGCDEGGDYYKYFVEDTGIGIKEEYQEQIFKIFNRLKDIEQEGTGVGLAIVKKIVEIHKGKIWVESPVKDGKGTRFCFTIPISKK